MRILNVPGIRVLLGGIALISTIASASPVTWTDLQWFSATSRAEFGSGAVAISNFQESPPDKVYGSVSATISGFPRNLNADWQVNSRLVLTRRFVWSHLDGPIMELNASLLGGMTDNSSFLPTGGGGIFAGYTVGAYIAKLDPSENCTAQEVANTVIGFNFDHCVSGIANAVHWPFGNQSASSWLTGGGIAIAGDFPLFGSVNSLSEDLGSGQYVAVGFLDSIVQVQGQLSNITDGTDFGYGRTALTLQMDVNRAVPEPSSIFLVLSGIALAGTFGNRRMIQNFRRYRLVSAVYPFANRPLAAYG